MPSDGLLRRVDAVQVPVPSLDEGLAFYGEALGHRLLWRNDAIGQAGLQLPDGDSELVLTTTRPYEPNWLVDDVPAALTHITTHGGTVLTGPLDIPVGRAAAVQDPFGNTLILVDLSKGLYTTTPDGTVTDVHPTTS
jgi:predicted enzyme related to lactoylglutathione lyase